MLEALTRVFQEIVNNFYKQGVTVELSDTPDTAYCQGDHITLPKHLLEEFTAQKLPRFTVLYHELGHALYSHDLNSFIDKWSNLPASHNSFMFDEKYMHLLNWIEDFYIEEQLVKDYPFLKDLVSCLKQLTLPYDINAIDKTFNHYYVKGYASLTLAANDAYIFTNYINKLLSIRRNYGFGRGPISLLSAKSRETQFIKTIIEFYNWCVSKQIFKPNQVLPKLSNPNMTAGNQASNQSQGQGQDQGQGQIQGQDQDKGIGGSSSDHSHMIGVAIEEMPMFDPKEVEIFSDKFISEQKLIKEEISKQFRVESTEQSLDGLFNSMFKNTSIIQPKVIIPNFFNPNRLVDQVLFKTPDKSFNNVSIYRDISGSTTGDRHSLINEICKFLDQKIPIAYNFYLYASGDISIFQTTFEDWDDSSVTPNLYNNDPIFQQLEGGTNSDAIADVISEQLNDKWLNIIITDGDLHSLMRRQNIQALLENVFVISIIESNDIRDCPHHIVIDDESLISTIPQAILHMKGA